jgi:hypothetical protein
MAVKSHKPNSITLLLHSQALSWSVKVAWVRAGFIDIVDVNERLLVKPAPTNIVINLWHQ